MAPRITFADSLLGNNGYSIGRAVLFSTLSGIVGGIGFGILSVFYAPTLIINIAHLGGYDSVPGGWAYHLFNAAVIGSIFGLVLGRVCTSYRVGILWGLAYGFIWWILGGLTLFPLLMGYFNSVLVVSINSWVGLVGHLIFGFCTGLGTTWAIKQRTNSAAPNLVK